MYFTEFQLLGFVVSYQIKIVLIFLMPHLGQDPILVQVRYYFRSGSPKGVYLGSTILGWVENRSYLLVYDAIHFINNIGIKGIIIDMVCFDFFLFFQNFGFVLIYRKIEGGVEVIVLPWLSFLILVFELASPWKKKYNK